MGLKNDVPFLLENRMKELGGNYQKKENWAKFSVKDGNLITGQNPASSKLVAEDIINTFS